MKSKRKNIDKKLARKNNVSHLIIRYEDALADPVLNTKGNRGRKYSLCKLYKNNECRIAKGLDSSYPDFVIWKPDADGKAPVLEVGIGGTEMTFFNEKTKQDRHKHLLATEIYTILEGEMKIKINDKEIKLNSHDEVAILPGTIQEILPEGSKFITRGRTINCHGKSDKYIEVGGKWKSLESIK